MEISARATESLARSSVFEAGEKERKPDERRDVA
jgi:hypothetical protein